MFKRTVGGILLVFAGVLGGALGYYALDSRQSEQEAQAQADWSSQQKLTNVKFVIHVPANTPKDQPIFLSGSMPPFPWEAAGPPLTRQPDGTYTTTLEMMTGLSNEFKVTRGTWSTVECNADESDIANRTFVPKGDDVIDVNVVAWRDHGIATPGRVTYTGDIREHKKITDGAIGNERSLTVYLPPGYDDAANADKHYPVLYLNDGQNLFDQSVSYNGIEWQCDETAQKLISEGKIEPLIIVGIWNTPDRNAEYTPAALLGGAADGATTAPSKNEAYAKLVLETIKPMIDARYRTNPEPAYTAIGGSGLGGLSAISIVQQHPEAFGKLALLTPQLRAGGKPISSLLTDASMFKDKQIWLDASPDPASHSTSDPVSDASALADQLGKAGVTKLNFTKLDTPAASETAWQQRFDRVLLYLYGK